ncbi:hypothetical protein PCL_08937 [Purpureocillium lilacinum]|uniref:Uncharacterized protein n=1 Tax=Purpureocillium lilacinum TaxID=33203 RepID=A0A2U3EGN1_PURLI|nr:hypothetical protein PCL_08937 [Purpureocillium lilacinum]
MHTPSRSNGRQWVDSHSDRGALDVVAVLSFHVGLEHSARSARQRRHHQESRHLTETFQSRPMPQVLGQDKKNRWVESLAADPDPPLFSFPQANIALMGSAGPPGLWLLFLSCGRLAWLWQSCDSLIDTRCHAVLRLIYLEILGYVSYLYKGITARREDCVHRRHRLWRAMFVLLVQRLGRSDALPPLTISVTLAPLTGQWLLWLPGGWERANGVARRAPEAHTRPVRSPEAAWSLLSRVERAPTAWAVLRRARAVCYDILQTDMAEDPVLVTTPPQTWLLAPSPHTMSNACTLNVHVKLYAHSTIVGQTMSCSTDERCSGRRAKVISALRRDERERGAGGNFGAKGPNPNFPTAPNRQPNNGRADFCSAYWLQNVLAASKESFRDRGMGSEAWIAVRLGEMRVEGVVIA